jgi:hypothetical protein
LAVHLEFGYGRSPSCVPFIIADALSTNTVLTTLNLKHQRQLQCRRWKVRSDASRDAEVCD